MTSQILWAKGDVTGLNDQGHVEHYAADVALCSACRSDAFHIYHVEGQPKEHLHFQCESCGLAYCQRGTCETIEVEASDVKNG